MLDEGIGFFVVGIIGDCEKELFGVGVGKLV